MHQASTINLGRPTLTEIPSGIFCIFVATPILFMTRKEFEVNLVDIGTQICTHKIKAVYLHIKHHSAMIRI